MLFVVQFPMADARGLTADETGRVSRPDWGNIETYENPEFVRFFGHVVRRVNPADVAWADERFFCRAARAIALPDLQSSRNLRCAFRRLFVAEERIVARTEIGLSPANSGRTAEALVEEATRIARLTSRVADATGPGSDRQLISQGRRLTKLYASATSRKGTPPSAERLVEAGRPVLLVELRRGEKFLPPIGATVIDAERVGGSDLAFFWLATDSGGIPTWIMRPGRDPARSRSLRLCLLRLNAEREGLGAVVRLMNREWLRFAPGTDPGVRLRNYLKSTVRRLDQESWAGISQGAIHEALTATQEVTAADEQAGLTRSLEGIEYQIADKVEMYFKEREATRPSETFYVAQGGIGVNRGIEIKNSTVNNSNVIAAEKMRDALVRVQAAPVDDERKAAIADLVKVATDLVEQLPDEQAKKDVTKRVEVITKQAEDPDPLEDVVRAAGETIVKIGQGVADFAGPIASAVNKVLSILKFAPLVL